MINPNDPAFPEIHNDSQMLDRHGLTKREYFAGLAMQGILSSKNANPTISVRIWAVAEADALIAELSKPT